MSLNVLYLDNAATSHPKPPLVAQAMSRYMAEVGASAGRGRYASAERGAEILWECRERVSRLLGADGPERVVFTLNGTDALHLAIAGTIRQRRRERPGERIHVVTTALDHNSVLRPLAAFADDGVDTTHVEPDASSGAVTAAAISRAIRPETALVAIVHASNVTGVIQPAKDIADVCRAAGVPMLLDAAQSAGHVPMSIRDLGVAMAAMPGHKGLLGPLGTGVLVLTPGAEDLAATVREGGTGNWSEVDRQPQAMPTRYEAGSHNAVGLAGLSQGVVWLLERGVEAIRLHEMDLTRALIAGLSRVSGVRVLGPEDARLRVGVVSFVHDQLSPNTIAHALEREHGIFVRAGLHCAPRAHRFLGTFGDGGDAAGAVRISLGPFLTLADVDRVCKAVRDVCAMRSAGRTVAASPAH